MLVPVVLPAILRRSLALPPAGAAAVAELAIPALVALVRSS